MKRWLALLLAAALCFSLTACGGNESTSGGNESASKDKLIADAELLDKPTFINDFNDNRARIESNYIGNPYKFTVEIRSIESDYALCNCIPFDKDNLELVSIGAGSFKFVNMKVYLPSDALSELESNTIISVVGTFDSLDKDENGNDILIVKPANMISDTFDINGKIIYEEEDIVNNTKLLLIQALGIENMENMDAGIIVGYQFPLDLVSNFKTDDTINVSAKLTHTTRPKGSDISFVNPTIIDE